MEVEAVTGPICLKTEDATRRVDEKQTIRVPRSLPPVGERDNLRGSLNPIQRRLNPENLPLRPPHPRVDAEWP